jgi:hypothetical protein
MKYKGPIVLALLVLLGGAFGVAQTDKPKQKKPSLSLKASPAMSFAPSRIVFTADAKGGSDDYEEFYCATVTWEWGDGTESQKATDCEPYEAGKSLIQRRFTIDHRYEYAGEYRVIFKLERSGKVVGATSTTVRVRPGLRDIGE